MLHRKLAQYCAEQRSVWVFLKDQQCWLEEATVVDVDVDLVTFRYEEEDDEADERLSWEVCVPLDSIGAVSTRLANVNRMTGVEDLTTTGDCPEAERLGLP
ncbi:MAG: DUF6679 family protein [Cyanobacteriota bacterium]|jgi:hypothetical protein|nr:DUF6679 family protein [Cyanobacteriota bacterium]